MQDGELWLVQVRQSYRKANGSPLSARSSERKRHKCVLFGGKKKLILFDGWRDNESLRCVCSIGISLAARCCVYLFDWKNVRQGNEQLHFG